MNSTMFGAPQIVAGFGTAACLTAVARLIGSFHGRRRMNAALSAINSGGSAADALRAAQVDGTAVWLELRPEAFEYAIVPEPGISLSAEMATEVSRRALRPGEHGVALSVISAASRCCPSHEYREPLIHKSHAVPLPISRLLRYRS
jgi:hypothetical protein